MRRGLTTLLGFLLMASMVLSVSARAAAEPPLPVKLVQSEPCDKKRTDRQGPAAVQIKAASSLADPCVSHEVKQGQPRCLQLCDMLTATSTDLVFSSSFRPQAIQSIGLSQALLARHLPPPRA